jgi:hypothetical protein
MVQKGGVVMVESLLSILIVAMISVGTYYASYRFVHLRHNRDVLADEYKRAETYIKEMEDRIAMLEAERDLQTTRMSGFREEQASGWESLNVRS